MTCAVGAGDAGAVETEDHGEAVQADIEVDLVDRPGEEGRVDGDERAEATHRHAGCRRDGVLLGDADIDASIGESFAEGRRPVESGMAAVIATSSGCWSPSFTRVSEKAAV